MVTSAKLQESKMPNTLSRSEIDAYLFKDESALIRSLADKAKLSNVDDAMVLKIATNLVEVVRKIGRAHV